MNISQTEAQEALTSIKGMTHKMRHALAASGASITLIATGIVWLVGFMASQFLSGPAVAVVWVMTSVLGSALAVILGRRSDKTVRSPLTSQVVKRVSLYWLVLILFALAVMLVARPEPGKQTTMLVILFIMLGQFSMGLLFSFSSVWWAPLITVLALAGFYLFPGYFFLWLALLGGGGMIALGVYIRLRW
jgi:hypothetical protein